jgi:ABC-2 type transport system permease protein
MGCVLSYALDGGIHNLIALYEPKKYTQMKLTHTIYYELLHLKRDAFKIAAIILFTLASAYGLYNGYSLYDNRLSEISSIKEISDKQHQEAFGYYEEGLQGPESRPWVNVNLPFWAMWYGTHQEFDTPSPLMTYSVGQAEQFAYYKRVSVWSTGFDKDLTAEISNPERVALGTLDFSFVWLFLMPLLLIVLTYSIHGLEKDLGFNKLIKVQQSKTNKWIINRFIAIGLFFTLLLILLTIVPAILGGFLTGMSYQIFLIFLYNFGYLVLWVVLLTFISIKGSGQRDIAIKMVGLWLILTIVLPGFVHQYISLKHPTDLMMDIINAQRDDREEIYALPLEEVKEIVFTAYPALRESKLNTVNDTWLSRPARSGLFRTALNLHMNEKINEVIQSQEERNAAIKALYIINPVMAFQNRINALSKTDFTNNQHFRERIQEKAALINEILIKEEWNDAEVDETRFKKYIKLKLDE